jgi:hypothetical protein
VISSRAVRRVLFAVALAGAAAIATALYALAADTYVPQTFESYDVSTDEREVTVAFCGSTNERVIFPRAREEDRSVVVDVRVWIARNYFHNGTVHRVTFELAAPLGERAVRDATRRAIPRRAQFLCPG